MRKELSKLDAQRKRFKGSFVRYGSKENWHGFPEPTILLKNIIDLEKGIIVSDHLWFSLTKQFEKLGILEPDTFIYFDARVSSYVKGYVNYREDIDERELDYKLNYPTKVSITEKNEKI